MSKTTNSAIYAGSFDPITNGHIDIIERALQLFDTLYISVIQNPDKDSFFSVERRITLIKEIFKHNDNIIVEGFNRLLVDYAREKKVFTLIRGLRAVSDFDFEFQMSHINRTLETKIETVFLMTDAKYSYLSSSVVKQLANLNGTITQFVPKCVEKALREGNNE